MHNLLPFSREKRPQVDGDTLGHSLAQVAVVAKVLDDDNLLREILVRVGFPTTLVRAALVCKRWLGHASDPKFISCFRNLHPPRLLGFYITEESILLHDLDTTHSVPMLPQPPELSTVIHRLESYNYRHHTITHCQDGSIFTGRYEGKGWTYEVHRPLCYERHTQIVPPLPRMQDGSMVKLSEFFSKEEGNSMSYRLYVLGESTEERDKSTVCVYMLQDGEWRMDTLATCPHGLHLYPAAVHIGHNKIYIPSAINGDIIIFDRKALSFSTIQLPQGVEYYYLDSLLSRADDASSVYLIHVKGFELRIWLHKGDNWLLVDTMCMREMLSTLGIYGHTFENEGIANVLIRHVGDNGQFAILQMGNCIFYLDIKRMTLCKVYEKTVNDRSILS